MWGDKMVCDGREYSLPSIDKINEVFEKKESTIESCLIRFSLELFCLKDNYGKKYVQIKAANPDKSDEWIFSVNDQSGKYFKHKSNRPCSTL